MISPLEVALRLPDVAGRGDAANRRVAKPLAKLRQILQRIRM